MNEKDIVVLECAKEIKKYCKNKDCMKCPFAKNDGCMFIRDKRPDRWNLLQEQILDNKEKEYLKNIIEPFKNRVQFIVKNKRIIKNKEYIVIVTDENYPMTLPDFDLNAMYKVMETDIKYTLKELGL